MKIKPFDFLNESVYFVKIVVCKNSFYLLNPIFVKIENPHSKKNGQTLKTEGRYSYYEAGEGTPIVILHGLMADLATLMLLPITLQRI
jgi:hypothetical protein